MLERLDLNDLKERWLTKKEKMLVEQQQEIDGEEHIENDDEQPNGE